MSKRKRIRKGLESVRKQIELHKNKLENAIKEGKAELADYYKKEIERLVSEVERRERLLIPKKKRKR